MNIQYHSFSISSNQSNKPTITTMDSLKLKIGTLAFSECENFINLSLSNAINSFIEHCKVDVSPDLIAEFLENYEPKASPKVAKRSDSKLAWQGFAKDYRANNSDAKAKEIGDAWKSLKTDVSDEDWTRFISLGETKTEKKPRKSSGNAWHGFRLYFASKNPEIAKKDVTSEASKAWNKGDGVSDKKKAKYIKLAEDHKKVKEEAANAKKAKKTEEEDSDDEPIVV